MTTPVPAPTFRNFVIAQRENFLANVRPDIQARRLAGHRLSTEEYDALHPMNSYDRHHLFPIFSDALLLREARRCLENSTAGSRPFYEWALSGATYDDALTRDFVPALIERLADRVSEEAGE